MRVHRSVGQPDLTYVLLSDADIVALIEALRKPKTPIVKALRKALKEAHPHA